MNVSTGNTVPTSERMAGGSVPCLTGPETDRPGRGAAREACGHWRRIGIAASLAGRRVAGRLLEIGDQVGALLRILDPGIAHLCAGHRLQRILEEAVERLLVPGDAVLLHRRRVGVGRNRAGLAAEQATMARADTVVRQGVTGEAARVDLLAAPRIAIGRQGGGATEQRG